MWGSGEPEWTDGPSEEGRSGGAPRGDDAEGVAGELSLRLEIGPEGAVVVKRARGGAVAHLVREAEVLGRVGHPGLVELVECREHDGATELITRHAGSATLGQHSPASAATIAWLGAGIASTLADLHAAGFAHTHLSPDHVVLDGAGRTVLCSLGRAQEATASTVRTDLDDLVGLLIGLLRRVPDRRSGTRRMHRALDAALAMASETPATMAHVASLLAAVPGVEPPVSAPSVATGAPLIGSLENHEKPDAAVPVDGPRPGTDAAAGPVDEPAGDTPLLAGEMEDLAAGGATRTWRDRVRPEPALAAVAAPRRLLVRLALVAVVAGFLTAGALLAWRSDLPLPRADVSEGDAPTVVAEVATVAGSIASSMTGSDSTGLGPETGCGAAVAPSAACAGDVELFGGVVRVGTEWYALAGYRDGDAVFVGDWDCDGLVTPAVYRATAGQLFEFGDWSGASVEVRATARSHQVAAGSVHKVAGDDGCDALVQRTASGELEPLVAR